MKSWRWRLPRSAVPCLSSATGSGWEALPERSRITVFKPRFVARGLVAAYLLARLPVLPGWAGLFLVPSPPPRLMSSQVLGSDATGTIEAVDRKVTAFRPGDDVFGDLS